MCNKKYNNREILVIDILSHNFQMTLEQETSCQEESRYNANGIFMQIWIPNIFFIFICYRIDFDSFSFEDTTFILTSRINGIGPPFSGQKFHIRGTASLLF